MLPIANSPIDNMPTLVQIIARCHIGQWLFILTNDGLVHLVPDGPNDDKSTINRANGLMPSHNKWSSQPMLRKTKDVVRHHRDTLSSS